MDDFLTHPSGFRSSFCPRCGYDLRGLAYVFLPVLLRRARVRESHVARITLYGAFHAVFAMIILHLYFSPHTEFVSAHAGFFRVYVSLLYVAIATCVLFTTQYFAVCFNLKLPHAFAASSRLTFLSALLTLACFTAWTRALNGARWLADFQASSSPLPA